MFAVLGKLWWFFREHWKRYMAAVLLLVFVGFLDVIPPWLIGVLVDGVHQGTLTGGAFAFWMSLWAGIAAASYLLTIIWQRGLFGGSNVL